MTEKLRQELADVALLLPGMFGAGGGVEIVVVDVGLHFDEEVGVEVVVAGASVVVDFATLNRPLLMV